MLPPSSEHDKERNGATDPYEKSVTLEPDYTASQHSMFDKHTGVLISP